MCFALLEAIFYFGNKIRYAALFGKALLAEGGAILALQQKKTFLKQAFASSMESTVGSCHTSLQ